MSDRGSDVTEPKPAILLVGSGVRSLRSFFTGLEQEGFEIVEAPSYKRAMETLGQKNVEVVASDLALGDDSALDIMQRIIERGLFTYMVIYAEKEDPAVVKEAMRLGAYDYVLASSPNDVLARVARRAMYHKLRTDLERVRDKDTRRYRYRLLDAIFRNINEGIITVDNDMRMIEANQATDQICQIKSARLIGKDVADGPYTCSVRCHKALRETLRSHSPVKDFQIECSQASRPNQAVSLNTSPLLDEENNFFGAVMIIKDVTVLADLERELEDRYQFGSIIGQSDTMREVFRIMEALATTETTALITGETGSGKELVARAIHFAGARALKPFVAVNCAALAEELLESELFGHVKGAFTGAVKDKVGRFQMANGGSLFLDEIGEVSPRMQQKLLRVLQEREFEPVGSEKTTKVDVRVIAATNRDLPQMVMRGEFREDLYYRLNVVELKIPPLRERRVDIPALIKHFIDRYNKKFTKEIDGVSEEALHILMSHLWPGNIRELEHAIEHAFVLCQGTVITVDALPPDIVFAAGQAPFPAKHPRIAEPTPEEDEKSLEQKVQEALVEAGGNKAKAARILGVSRQTIYRKIGMVK